MIHACYSNNLPINADTLYCLYANIYVGYIKNYKTIMSVKIIRRIQNCANEEKC